MPEIVVVSALTRNRVIGRAGRMPWHLPADLRHFRKLTTGYPVVMGRRTFQAIGRPLPGRINVVVSRSLGASSRPELVVVDDLQSALCEDYGTGRVMVAGGAEVYRQVLPQASRLELTLIDAHLDGDAFFPEFALGGWRLQTMHCRPADHGNDYPLRFCTFVAT